MSGAALGRRAGKLTVAADLRDVLAHRDLLFLLAQKELKVKYKGTFFGMLWSLLNPLFLAAVYSIVFTTVARSFTTPRYPVFVLSGVLPWSAFTSSVGTATTSIVLNGNLVRRVRFPGELLPITTVLANVVNILPGFLILFAVALLFGQPLGLPLVMLPVLVVLQTCFTLGIALIASSLTVFFRDIEHLVQIGLTVWFFGTPVLYPLTALSGQSTVRRIILANPMTWLLDGYQHIWHSNAFPNGRYLAAYAVTALVLLVGGWLLFRRAAPRFAEEV